MYKFILSVCSGMLLAQTSFAQSFDLASEIGSDAPAEEIEVQKNEKAVADDRGIFSFLNFSFIKKPAKEEIEIKEGTQQPTETKVNETPLQKLLRLADEGNANAQLSLGYMYLYGTDGVNVDHAQAFKYYEIAAAQDNKIALNNLGSLYFNGIGTQTNYLKAAQLFARAAELGSDDAAVNLAFIYLSGSNQNKNLDETIATGGRCRQQYGKIYAWLCLLPWVSCSARLL